MSNRGALMLSTAPIRAYIPAAHLERARKFYEEIVGLKPAEAYAGGVVYIWGGAVAELKARGVVFEEYTMPGIPMKNGIATAGGAKTAWFKDSEGNIMAVSQRLQ